MGQPPYQGQPGQWGPPGQGYQQQGGWQQPQQGPPPGYQPGPPQGQQGWAPPPQAQQQGDWGAPAPANWDRMYETGEVGMGDFADGTFPVTVVEAGYGVTRNGDKNQWTVKVRLDGGPNAGATLTDWLTISEYTNDGKKNTAGIGILMSELRALGIPVGEKYGDPPGTVPWWRTSPDIDQAAHQVATAMVGRTCMGVISHDKQQRVNLRLKPGQPGQAPQPAAYGGQPQQQYQQGPPPGYPQGPPQPGYNQGPPPQQYQQGPPQQAPPGYAQTQAAPGGPPMTPQAPAPAMGQPGGMAEFQQQSTWNPGGQQGGPPGPPQQYQQQGPPPQQQQPGPPTGQPPWPGNGMQPGQEQQPQQGPPGMGQGPGQPPWRQ